jgi:hypothetical protein
MAFASQELRFTTTAAVRRQGDFKIMVLRINFDLKTKAPVRALGMVLVSRNKLNGLYVLLSRIARLYFRPPMSAKEI